MGNLHKWAGPLTKEIRYNEFLLNKKVQTVAWSDADRGARARPRHEAHSSGFQWLRPKRLHCEHTPRSSSVGSLPEHQPLHLASVGRLQQHLLQHRPHRALRPHVQEGFDPLREEADISCGECSRVSFTPGSSTEPFPTTTTATCSWRC